jgi:hypothetical protein
MSDNIISEQFETKVITEETHGKKWFYLQGPAAVAEQFSKNSRRYPAKILEREINAYQQKIRSGEALGELTHSMENFVDPRKVSHLFVECKRDGNVRHAKARLLDTPMGNIARGIVEGSGRLGFSTRGTGSLRSLSEGRFEVADDYRLCTLADLVTDPSAPHAWTQAIIESVSNYYTNDNATNERLDEIRRQALFGGKLTEERTVQLFRKFLRG